MRLDPMIDREKLENSQQDQNSNVALNISAQRQIFLFLIARSSRYLALTPDVNVTDVRFSFQHRNLFISGGQVENYSITLYIWDTLYPWGLSVEENIRIEILKSLQLSAFLRRYRMQILIN